MSPFEPKQPSRSPGSESGKPQQSVVKFSRESSQSPERLLPTLFGTGYGTYQARPENYVLSFVSHTAVIALALWLFHVTVQPKIMAPIKLESIDLSDYPMTVGKGGPSGGGGGVDKIKASAGTPPKPAKIQIAPPVVLPPQESKLKVEPTVIADLKIPQNTQVGDPLSKLLAPSNGIGVGPGIGGGDGGGVGGGHGGPGVGPGIFHLGEAGVTAPRILYKTEPEFSEEARKAKYQGVVGLNVVIGPDGRIHNAQVVHSLGMGLDEKAIEGVKLWKFDPAKKDGRPVAVAVYIEVDYHLY